MLSDDFYGNRYKWFIGVVKDIDDPLNSNRVRVRIKGIHPEDSAGDLWGGYGAENFNQSAPNSTGITTNSGTVTSQQQATSPTGGTLDSPNISPKSLVQVDEANLPKDGSNENQKISQHYTLGDLTTRTVMSGWRCRQNMHNITPEIIKNLSMLATNVLDPVKQQFPSLIITSGWRPYVAGSGYGGSPKNHPFGYAADIQLPGRRGAPEIFQWIKANLHGKYNYMIFEGTWCHVQLGGSQGSTDSPLHQGKS